VRVDALGGARGHDVSVAGDWALGRLSAVGIDRERSAGHATTGTPVPRGTPVFWAAANPRGMQGYASGR